MHQEAPEPFYTKMWNDPLKAETWTLILEAAFSRLFFSTISFLCRRPHQSPITVQTVAIDPHQLGPNTQTAHCPEKWKVSTTWRPHACSVWAHYACLIHPLTIREKHTRKKSMCELFNVCVKSVELQYKPELLFRTWLNGDTDERSVLVWDDSLPSPQVTKNTYSALIRSDLEVLVLHLNIWVLSLLLLRCAL